MCVCEVFVNVHDLIKGPDGETGGRRERMMMIN